MLKTFFKTMYIEIRQSDSSHPNAAPKLETARSSKKGWSCNFKANLLSFRKNEEKIGILNSNNPIENTPLECPKLSIKGLDNWSKEQSSQSIEIINGLFPDMTGLQNNTEVIPKNDADEEDVQPVFKESEAVESYKKVYFLQGVQFRKYRVKRENHNESGICFGLVVYWININCPDLNDAVKMPDKQQVRKLLKKDGGYFYSAQIQDIYYKSSKTYKYTFHDLVGDGGREAALCYGISLERSGVFCISNSDRMPEILKCIKNIKDNEEFSILVVVSKNNLYKDGKKEWRHAIGVKWEESNGVFCLMDPNLGEYEVPEDDFPDFLDKFFSEKIPYNGEKGFEPIERIYIEKALWKQEKHTIIFPKENSPESENSWETNQRTVQLILDNNFKIIEQYLKSIEQQKNRDSTILYNTKKNIENMKNSGESLRKIFEEFSALSEYIEQDSKNFIDIRKFLEGYRSIMQTQLDHWQSVCEYVHDRLRGIYEEGIAPSDLIKQNFNLRYLNNYIETLNNNYDEKIKKIEINSCEKHKKIKVDLIKFLNKKKLKNLINALDFQYMREGIISSNVNLEHDFVLGYDIKNIMQLIELLRAKDVRKLIELFEKKDVGKFIKLLEEQGIEKLITLFKERRGIEKLIELYEEKKGIYKFIALPKSFILKNKKYQSALHKIKALTG